MTEPLNPLDDFVAGADWNPDWSDVLDRSGHHTTMRSRPSRRVVLVTAFAAALVVLVPLCAVAAVNDWWFLRGSPATVVQGDPAVIKSGDWGGRPWDFVAYPNAKDGLCFGITPAAEPSSSFGASMNCGPFGPARSTTTNAHPDIRISFVSGQATRVLPAYIAGPVVTQAATVLVKLNDGTTLRTPTFSAPPPLEHVRFYATSLPTTDTSEAGGPSQFFPFAWIAGLDKNNRIVACFKPPTPQSTAGGAADCS